MDAFLLTGCYTGAAPKGVECDSSKSKRKSRTRQTCGFFAPVPDLFLAGRVATRKDAHLTCFRLSTSRPPCRMRVIAHRQGHQSLSKERIMASATLGTSAQITPFNFGTHAVRVVMRNGEPWFVATDVAEALGYRNAPDAARNLSEHQKASTQIVRSTSGGNPNVTIINESGLYRLVLRSRKPEAEKFSDWVTGEVLPSIRKTGSYGEQPKQFITDKRWLVSFRDGREVVQAIDATACLLKYEDLPKLLLDPENPVGSALLADIAASCIQRLASQNRNLVFTCESMLAERKRKEG
jgi:prophage antirepressor-like protein